MADLTLYTFAPNWGLPTAGPFALKLEMALRNAGIAYERKVHDNVHTAPKRKIPFVEKDGQRMGDSELILEWLGVDPDEGLSPQERAQGMAFRRLLEEHWHQVEEWELFVDPDGLRYSMATAGAAYPAPIRALAGWWFRRHYRGHLYERGMGRHSPEDIVAFGKKDLDAVAAWLDGRRWFFQDRPTLTDCSAFGLLAIAFFAEHPTPCFTHARSLPPLRQFVDRCADTFFPELRPQEAIRLGA